MTRCHVLHQSRACAIIIIQVTAVFRVQCLERNSLDPSPSYWKRGPGNHCLRVGGFNSKFVSKTLCILSINLLYYGHPRGWLINYYQETSQLVRGSLILLRWHQTSVWKQVDLPVAENRSVLTEKGSPLYHNILTNLLRYLDPQDSWGKWRMRKCTRPSFSIESGLESRLRAEVPVTWCSWTFRLDNITRAQ